MGQRKCKSGLMINIFIKLLSGNIVANNFMKKYLLILSSFLLLIPNIAFGAEIGDNLLSNGSFVEGLTDWSTFVPASPYLYFSTSTQSADGDDASITLSNGGNENLVSCVYQEFLWNTDEITELSLWQKASSTYPHPSGQFFLSQYNIVATNTGWIFNWITNEWEEQTFENYPTSDYSKVISLNYQNWAKTTLLSDIQPPTSSENVLLFFCVNFPQQDQMVWVDDFNLEVIDKVSEEPTTPTSTETLSNQKIIIVGIMIVCTILLLDFLRRLFMINKE